MTICIEASVPLVVTSEVPTVVTGTTLAGAIAGVAVVYWNTQQQFTASCTLPLICDPVTIIVPPHTFSSLDSQADADQQALNSATTQATGALLPYVNYTKTFAWCPHVTTTLEFRFYIVDQSLHWTISHVSTGHGGGNPNGGLIEVRRGGFALFSYSATGNFLDIQTGTQSAFPGQVFSLGLFHGGPVASDENTTSFSWTIPPNP